MPDYTPTQIKSAYAELCKKPTFSSRLKSPTSANIKRACQDLYLKKNGLTDKYVLINFLGLREEEDVALALRRTELDKFKPVVNFLIDKTAEPRDETIDLIAWLIDFKSESSEKEVSIYDDTKDSKDSKEDAPLPPTTLPLPTPPTKPERIIRYPSLKRITRNITIYLTLLSSFTYLFVFEGINRFKKTEEIRMPKPNELCMYWTGNHYEPIACRDSIYHLKKIIPLNLKELLHLKKINRPDTLTLNDVGKIWYRKINNKLHLFTSGGRFPLDTSKTLRPLTQHMYDQHIANKQNGLTKWDILIYVILGAAVITGVIEYFILIIFRKKRSKQYLEKKTG